MNQSYSVIAKYYDKFTNKDCDYEGWSQYLYSVASRHNAREVVDIACGTAKITKPLVDMGLKVIGVDQSEQMLGLARAKCKAQFVMQDMRKLQLAHAVDMAVCVNDGVNYLTPSELQQFFERVAASVKQGAPFVFDISSEYKLTNIVGNNVFYWDDDTETLLWANSLKGNCVEMNLTLFVEQEDGAYTRCDERHVQYVHSVVTISNALLKAGFDLVEITSEYGKQLTDNAERITFYAVKR